MLCKIRTQYALFYIIKRIIRSSAKFENSAEDKEDIYDDGNTLQHQAF